MRIDCFICNPPFGSRENTSLGINVMNKLNKSFCIVICPPNLVFHSLYKNIQYMESINFPNIGTNIGMFVLENKKGLFDKLYVYKRANKETKYCVESMNKVRSNKAMKIRKIGKDKTPKRKKYLDITEEEYNGINEIIENYDFSLWRALYKDNMTGPRFLIPTILAETKYNYLVEEVKK